VLVWTAWAVVTAEPVDFSFADYVRFYFASHFLIDVAHPAEVANGLALWFCAQHLCRRLGWNAWRFVLILVMVIFTVGVVTPYLVDARLIFNLHLLRIDGVMWFFGSILAAAASVQLLTVSPRTSDAAGVAVVTLLGLVLGNFVATAATIVIFALLQDAARWRTRVGLTWSVILATVAVAAPASMTGDWGAAAAWALGGVALIATGTGSQTKIAPKVPGLAVGALVVLMALLYLRLGVGASTLAYLLVLSAVLMAWLAPAPLREWTEGRHGLVVSVVMLLCLSAVSAVSIVRNSPPALSPETASQKERDWLEIAAWVRVHPDTHVMLVPVRVEDEVAHRNFSLWAKTPVWVDRKQGAAVMWSPAFHGTWRPRYQEVLTLTSPDDFASYAQSHGIQRFVAPRRELTIDCPAPYRSEKLTTTYALCRT